MGGGNKTNVKYHDDRVSLREKHLKRHLNMVDMEIRNRGYRRRVKHRKERRLRNIILKKSGYSPHIGYIEKNWLMDDGFLLVNM